VPPKGKATESATGKESQEKQVQDLKVNDEPKKAEV
jgi:hypothetical protein